MNPEESKIFGISINIILPIITFLLGFFASRFTMTKKERTDYKAKLQENSNRLYEEHNQKYKDFARALYNYVNKKENPDMNNFFDIATKGDLYFNHVKTICDSIISNNIDKSSVENTHLPLVKKVVEELLPEYYSALQTIARKKNFKYDGKLKEENYKSIFIVYNKFIKKNNDSLA